MISRRIFLTTVAGGLLAAPPAAEAQWAVKVWRIGFLGGSPSAVPRFIQAFEQGLRELGYVEGQNISIERRFSEGRAERLNDLATTLVRLTVDVIVVDACGAPLNAARQATSTNPIVVAACNDDLVATGLISSLARPGGNITGLSELTPELGAKRLELLKDQRGREGRGRSGPQLAHGDLFVLGTAPRRSRRAELSRPPVPSAQRSRVSRVNRSSPDALTGPGGRHTVRSMSAPRRGVSQR